MARTQRRTAGPGLQVRLFCERAAAGSLGRSRAWACVGGLGMNAEQREAFDRDGYIVVRDALSQQQVYALNAGFDERIQDVSGAGTDKDKVRFYIGDRPSSEIADRHGNKYSGRRFWSQAYRDLVDNPVVLPILREILGDRSYCHAAPNMPENLGPQFRLDHDNGALANDHAFAPRRAP